MDRKRPTVLIVDDAPDNIMVLEEILRDEYHIRAATSGERALEVANSDAPPDIVLMDVMMPGLSGFDVCRILKSSVATAFIPVVMVTVLTGQNDNITAIEAGADEFLSKPVDPVEVRARVRSLLRVKKLHDALQGSYRELKKLEELRENLTHMIVHDMRTLLSSVMGGLDFIYDYASVEGNPDAEEFHQMAVLNSQKLLQMVNDLLDITKMESGEMQLSLAPVNCGEVAAEAEFSVRALAHVHKLDFAVDVPLDLPLILADREMLRRVLVNLVDNAIKFTPPQGRVRLAANAFTPGFLTLKVSDSGAGIPAGYEEKIFEKFGQVDQGPRKKLSTGLGLTFCKMAVEMHGGSIGIDSEPGQGCNFKVNWPLA